MKKYLIALAGLVGLATSSMSTIAVVPTTKPQNNSLSIQAESKTITIKNQTFNEYVSDDSYKYVGIEISLTSNGIKGIDGLHEYNTIELPDIEAVFEKYDVKINFKGDKWSANKKIGSEDWFKTFNESKPVNNGWSMTAYIYTAATLWYSGNGDLMIRLAYKIYGTYATSPVRQGLNISFKTGSTVKIY